MCTLKIKFFAKLIKVEVFFSWHCRLSVCLLLCKLHGQLDSKPFTQIRIRQDFRAAKKDIRVVSWSTRSNPNLITLSVIEFEWNLLKMASDLALFLSGNDPMYSGSFALLLLLLLRSYITNHMGNMKSENLHLKAAKASITWLQHLQKEESKGKSIKAQVYERTLNFSNVCQSWGQETSF